MSETDLIHVFLGVVSAELPGVRVFRRNVAAIKLEGRFFRSAIAGQADLYCYLKGGTVIEIEVKSAIGKLSPAQANWRDWCVAWGIPWMQMRARISESNDETVRRWVSELRQKALELNRLRTSLHDPQSA